MKPKPLNQRKKKYKKQNEVEPIESNVKTHSWHRPIVDMIGIS